LTGVPPRIAWHVTNLKIRAEWASWIRGAALALFVAAPAATAELPRTSVIAAGDCRDPELFDSVRSLEKKLGQQGGVSLASEAEILLRLGSQPSKAAEELQGEIDTAQQQFYQARYGRAIKQLEGALQEIARLAPGPRRWQLEVRARLLEGLIRTRLQTDASSEDAFARVLRLDPAYKLDPDYFGPSTIERFEKVRRQIASAPHHALEISSTPPGAEVFLEGRSMGTTPYRASIPEGSYQLLVSKDGATSLHRELRLTAETSAQVDLEFEGAVNWKGVLCLADGREEGARLKYAVKLGSVLELDQVVLLRIQRLREGTSSLAATLLSVSRDQKIREGSLRLEGGHLASDSEFAELARFMTTGEQMPHVLPAPTAGEASHRGAAISASIAAPVPESVAASSPHGWRRPLALVAGSAGVAAMAAGIGFLIATREPRIELDKLRAEELFDAEAPQAGPLVEQYNLRRNIGIAGIGVGILAVAGGTALYLLDRRSEEQGARSPVVFGAPTADGFALSLAAGF
jgi:hypothetical protein